VRERVIEMETEGRSNGLCLFPLSKSLLDAMTDPATVEELGQVGSESDVR
jgi:hypothetical protein